MRSLAMVTGCGSRAGGSNAARVAVKALEEMSYSQIREKWCHDSDYSREIKTYTDKDGRICRLDNHDPIYADALPFDTFAECVNEQPKEWIIEGVIAHDEDSSWWGPSGGLKSTLIVDLAVSVAGDRDWRGHRFIRRDYDDETPRRSGVIIFATERAAFTRRRLGAYKRRENLPDDLPIEPA